MNKYAFMVYHKEYDNFLHKLRDLGVVHVKQIKSVADNADMQELLGIRKRIKDLTALAQKLNKESETTVDLPARTMTKDEGLRLIEKWEARQEKKAQLIIAIQAAKNEIAYMEQWGDFSYQTIENLANAGYVVSFFTCPASQFDPNWTDEYNAFIINEVQFQNLFVTVTKTGTKIDIDADRPKMPDRGLSYLKTGLAKLEDNLVQVDAWLAEHSAADLRTLEAFDRSLQNEYNLENVIVQTEREADETVMFLEGWTTRDQAANMEAELDRAGFFCRKLDIEPGESVPIQLKNNSFAHLFEPITKLYSLPNYGEIDSTALVAPFFMLFFGLCFGDGGYGLLVLLAASLLKLKIQKGSAMRPILSLAQWLGAMTIVVGILTGTFFGVALVDVPAFASVKDYFLNQDNLMTLSVVIGLVHIIYGKIVAAVKIKIQHGFKYSIAPWGWIFALTALILVFGLPFLNIELSPMTINILYGVGAFGLLLAFLYNSPGKNIFLNIGTGVWNAYNTASGLLGDTLSYIRLFAIGLTGGILGGVFNMLAIDQTASLPIFARLPLMLLILVAGHGLNIALCTISSLVHPMRLIFVEYFKNSEFEGGGKPYLPFKEV
jgi:V/A-type H+-transporting ATPase subunit I